MLTWSLIIPTYNRCDVLMRILPFAFAQTVRPVQIVIADSSDDWQETKARVMDLAKAHPDIALDYLHAQERSSATQRNLACRHATGDIVVMIDDDSFLYPDYVENLLNVYAADHANSVAGVNGVNIFAMPDAKASLGLVSKTTVSRKGMRMRERAMRYRLGRWFNSQILFQSMHSLFLKYEGPRNTAVPLNFSGMDVEATTFMSGHGLSVRREVALSEPLDTSLRYYAALEDLDASYRYGRHGILLRANSARLHHFEVAGGRIKRKTAIVFQLLNMLVFIKRHSDDPKAWLRTYRIMLWRRLLGEILKDGLSRRWDFPQTSGVLMALRHWRAVWRTPTDRLDEWYPEFQRRLLERI